MKKTYISLKSRKERGMGVNITFGVCVNIWEDNYISVLLPPALSIGRCCKVLNYFRHCFATLH